MFPTVSYSDLLPLDLLARALPRPGQAPPTQVGHRCGGRGHRWKTKGVNVSTEKINHLTNQVQMVQSRGSRGLRLAGAMATALSFPASQIFTNCDYFPAEFSLVATVKIPKLRPKVTRWYWTEPGLVQASIVFVSCVFWPSHVWSGLIHSRLVKPGLRSGLIWSGPI